MKILMLTGKKSNMLWQETFADALDIYRFLNQLRLPKIWEGKMTKTNKKFSVVGKRIPKLDAAKKAMGLTGVWNRISRRAERRRKRIAKQQSAD